MQARLTDAVTGEERALCRWREGHSQLIAASFWGTNKCSSGAQRTPWRCSNIWGGGMRDWRGTDRLASKAMGNIPKKGGYLFLFEIQQTYGKVPKNACKFNSQIWNAFARSTRAGKQTITCSSPKPVCPFLITTDTLIFVLIISLAFFIVLSPNLERQESNLIVILQIFFFLNL